MMTGAIQFFSKGRGPGVAVHAILALGASLLCLAAEEAPAEEAAKPDPLTLPGLRINL